MTNDVFCIGLTRTELQTLRVLLPTTFPILTTEPDALDEAMIEHIAEQARCTVHGAEPEAAHCDAVGGIFVCAAQA